MTEYPVRTPRGYWLFFGVLIFIAVMSGVWLGWLVGLDASRATPARIVQSMVPSVLACALPIGYWIGSAAYRIRGGRSGLRIYDDRIEVPGPPDRHPLVFRREDLVLNIRPVRLRIWSGAKLDHGSVIYLVTHAVRRSLSTLTLEDPRQTDPLLEDLQRFVTGNPPARREPHEPKPRTAYDDRLDRDLATVD